MIDAQNRTDWVEGLRSTTTGQMRLLRYRYFTKRIRLPTTRRVLSFSSLSQPPTYLLPSPKCQRLGYNKQLLGRLIRTPKSR